MIAVGYRTVRQKGMAFIRFTKCCWIFAAVASAAMLVWVAWKEGLTSAIMAGWVQAIGGVWTIGAAVWTYFSQAASKDREGILQARQGHLALLEGLHAELTVLSEYFRLQFDEMLSAANVGKPLNYFFQASDSPFPVFDSVVHDIGSLGEPNLCRQIIKTYGRGRGFISYMNANNKFMQAVEDRTASAMAAYPGDEIISQFEALPPDEKVPVPHHIAMFQVLRQKEVSAHDAHVQISDRIRKLSVDLQEQISTLQDMLKTAIERRAELDR
jgi:hypothetical protein